MKKKQSKTIPIGKLLPGNKYFLKKIEKMRIEVSYIYPENKKCWDMLIMKIQLE